MATLAGKTADIDFGDGKVAKGHAWEVTTTGNIEPDTGFGDAGVRSIVATTTEWSFTSDFHYEEWPDTTAAADFHVGDTIASGTIKWYVDGAKFLTGAVVITDITAGADATGLVTLRVAGEGNGALNYAGI